ncbi:hypothetical protein V8G54_014704 [Vigna mungo]|uniref:Uncharacterized protein n=1 Tax=Vigna mungo TaxID=3915 RepID=A0AAQ3RZQ1_VIGMU
MDCKNEIDKKKKCFNAYFSTLERKYMFIICNAILALLAISPPFHLQLQPQVSEEPLGDFLTIEEVKTQDYSEQVSAAEHDTDVLIIAEEEGGTGNSSEDQLANTDELNRKFEEFIRKMKEEMRIEAQRQPIEV